MILLVNDFMIAFVVFMFVRYLLPNGILGKDITWKGALVLSFFYALCDILKTVLKRKLNSY